MKTLLVIVWMGGHDWLVHTVPFDDMAACEKAKPLILAQLPVSFEPSWFGNRNKATCLEVHQ